MTCIVHHRHSKTGIVYVYESESRWDKERKQCVCQRKCIGHLDPTTGEVVPNRKKVAPTLSHPIVKSAGCSLLLDPITEKTGLRTTLKSSFPEEWDKILTCAYYLLSEGTPLCHCEQWSAGTTHPYNATLTSQRISELLSSLSGDKQTRFFRNWVKKISEKEYFALDITSVSSYSELISSVRYGYNRDGEALPQINFCMLVGEKSGLPVYYERYPGSIHDVSTLKRYLKTLDWLQADHLHLVMDKGFCSLKNISGLYASGYKFTLGMSRGLKFVKEAIREVKDTICSYENYQEDLGNFHYVSTLLKKWEGHRAYVQVYYDPAKREGDNAEFMHLIHMCEKELISGEEVAEHKELYENYFTLTETPKRGRNVVVDTVKVREHGSESAGYFVLMSNDVKDPVRALEIYRQKDAVEKAFANMKNELDGKRLRVRSEPALTGRLFMQFIAQIMYSEVRKTLRGTEVEKNMSVQDVFSEMKILNQVKLPGRKSAMYTEMTANQKKIMELFQINVQT